MPSYAPMSPRHQPDPNSLASRIRAFFDRNPDELLTYSDIAIKFDCTQVQARGAVQYLRSRDILSTMHVVCVPGKSNQPSRCDE